MKEFSGIMNFLKLQTQALKQSENCQISFHFNSFSLEGFQIYTTNIA